MTDRTVTSPGTSSGTGPSAPTPAGVPVGHRGIRVDVHERPGFEANGFLGLLVGLACLGLAAWLVTLAVGGASVVLVVLAVLLVVAALVVLSSLTVIQPGRTAVVQFFGRYVGTARTAGLVWLTPLSTRRTVSVRVRNFETARLKVNDADGNPVEIASIVVWQVADTAQASFAVEDVVGFVQVQAEAALRHVARSYAYDGPEGVESLRG